MTHRYKIMATDSDILDLPLELIEHVVGNLELTDICHLRLTCRVLRDKSSDHRFRTFFAQRKTNLSEKSLQVLNDISEHPQLCSAVKEITVLASVYDPTDFELIIQTQTKHVREQHGMLFSVSTVRCTEEEIEQAKKDQDIFLEQKTELTRVHEAGIDVAILTNIFHKLRKLSTLTFETAVHRDMNTRRHAQSSRSELWTSASQTFEVGMMAIARSSVDLEKLNIYGGEWGGALPSYILQKVLQNLKKEGITTALTNLRSLYICITAKSIEDDVPEDPRHYLAEFISLVPNLQELDLHGFLSGEPSNYNARIVDDIPKTAPLPKLRKCTLRGLRTDENCLMHFLQNSPHLTALTLRHIVLKSGNWSVIFDYCCRPSHESSNAHSELRNRDTPGGTASSSSSNDIVSSHNSSTCSNQLQTLYLDNLYPTLGQLLHFTSPSSSAATKFNEMHRIHLQSAEEIHKGLQYHSPRGRPKGSPALYKRMQERRREFGP